MHKSIYTIIILLLSFNAFTQIVNIPDPGFKEFLIFEGIDTNSDGEIQNTEAEAREYLSIYHPNNIVINY